MSDNAFIYKITNTVSGKCYIGETTSADPSVRWRRHKETIKRGVGCPALRDAVNKYGVDKFTFEVIRTCTLDERFDLERALIKEYNSQVPNGYNILPGGEGGGFLGKKHSPDSIAKIKETQKLFKEANPDYYETYREKHAEAMKKVDIGAAVKNSEAFKKALEEGRVGAAGWETTKTEEEREVIKKKISESVKSYFNGNGSNAKNIENHRKIMAKARGKKIDQYSLDGKFIATHYSMSDALRSIDKKSHCGIQQALDIQTRTAYGFKWKTHESKE